ncbi:NADH-quinone oxidoreductase, E subunit [Ehrlichia chaffeensis str. Heartland]|uniref:NADH-quinone oxidoreductase subunit E n=1 Tax=Ehrlichia chaffeensis (strain ATCC CRL-10679 / Arkansas) TaxID=205920 RepID=Q2GGK8_EHRCR|nr:NADH-quinone oxidoreductase subunit NuoE [Ehrlichia chaffeensis]ABD45549.1 NADH dehydrogenase I, E subunit [Ehrlichia chaffeensis str. Arkansas]AHX03696.1 NADH-quinone oxidoreductase, E subunit [Ehrlichia chaffeensis str. Heartland]AHX05583.1 NADH-quinone oxidoreductase, E subunit [Ehrlichia chaffeensis str. Jax]AHX06573.1 NADH-quinone oxidoreductase, E subunit [Ehrlichia chaffeensis str. Liberty]AHX07595.1 NADH-quinone oxidoreductase, E subunit [Ehrlichia chaffeensis str. Osceola]
MSNIQKNSNEHYTETFKFNKDNLKQANDTISKYPHDRKSSAVMDLLHIAQKQCGGFIPLSAMNYIADFLGMRLIHVYEVAKFYSMYNLSPTGKYLIQVCRTTPCWLCGSDDILKSCKELLNICVGETTSDNLFTLKEVECLGACVNAPVMQINDDYYEKLTPDKVKDILMEIQKKEAVVSD